MAGSSRTKANWLNWAKKVLEGAGKGAASEIVGDGRVQDKLEGSFLGFLKKYKGWFIGAGLFLVAAIVISVGSAVSAGKKARRFRS